MQKRHFRSLLVRLIGLLLLTSLMIPLSSAYAAPPNSDAEAFLNALNDKRSKAGVPTLQINPILQDAAQQMADTAAQAGAIKPSDTSTLSVQFKNMVVKGGNVSGTSKWPSDYVVNDGFAQSMPVLATQTIIGIGVAKNTKAEKSFFFVILVADSLAESAQPQPANPAPANPAPANPAPVASAKLSPEAEAFLKAINDKRSKAGVPVLQINPILQDAAQKAADGSAESAKVSALDLKAYTAQFMNLVTEQNMTSGTSTWMPDWVVNKSSNSAAKMPVAASQTLIGVGVAKSKTDAQKFYWYFIVADSALNATNPAPANPAPANPAPANPAPANPAPANPAPANPAPANPAPANPVAPTGTGNVQLDALIVTQGLQNGMNEMPLVRNRQTFVVAQISSRTGAAIPDVKGQLVVTTAQGQQLGVLEQINTNVIAELPAAKDRIANLRGKQLNLIFQLKPEWLKGDLTLTLKGAKPIACNEPADPTRDCAVNVSFTLDRPVLKVHILLGKQTKDGKQYAATEADALFMAKVIEAAIPVAKVEYTTEVWDYTDGPVATHDDAGKLLKLMKEKYANPKMHYVALFPSDKGGGGIAYQQLPFFVAFGVGTQYQTIIIHEFLHTFNLGHGYDEPGNPRDKRFPAYVDNTVSPKVNRLSADVTGPKAYHGFTITEGWYSQYSSPYGDRIIPNDRSNMGGDALNGGFWLSDFTYRYILEKLPTIYNR